MPALPQIHCHLCGSVELQQNPLYAGWRRVTSDCQPWASGGLFGECLACHLVQTFVTPIWQQEVETIYRNYDIYHQSGGAEQKIFAANTGQSQARSDAILAQVIRVTPLPPQGRLLDVGCGNGSLLRAASRLLPKWELHGFEVTSKNEQAILTIPGVERLHLGDLSAIEGGFDFISLIHVLEHIPSPSEYLRQLGRLLRPGGILLVETPDCAQNPFILLVADHCSHFATTGLAEIIKTSGFQVLSASGIWVPKETTVVARKTEEVSSATHPVLPLCDAEEILSGIDWLKQLLDLAQRLATRPHFGIFGTSIAATWLDAQLSGAARFFVDEDPARVGRKHMGRPILPLSQAQSGSDVLIALPWPLAGQVQARLARADIALHAPPKRLKEPQ